MSDQVKSARKPSHGSHRSGRRRFAPGATGANAAKLGQSVVKYQPTPKDGKQWIVAHGVV
jgi:hypothetical protein